VLPISHHVPPVEGVRFAALKRNKLEPIGNVVFARFPFAFQKVSHAFKYIISKQKQS
jgi:hypothetical protein